MSVVFTDSFTVGADVNIDAYPGTPDYAYNIGSGSNLSVNAANDRVQTTSTGQNHVARIINAAAPSGDQQIIATVGLNGVNNARGGLACRCATAGTSNLYLYLIDPSSGDLRIYRDDSASFVLLTNFNSGQVPSDGAQTMVVKAVTNGAQVDLTYTLNALTPGTYSDTHANRKTSGPPGVSIWCTTANTGAYVDDVSVDDLVTGRRWLFGAH